MSARERFDKFFIPEPNGGCWLWMGYINRKGYGNFRFEGRSQLSHSAAYKIFVGPILAGFEIDHKCRQRSCVNPDHLEAVTHQTNLLRGDTIVARHAVKTHCSKGHPFDEANTLIERGGRKCLTCKRHYVRLWHRRKSAERTAA